MERIEQIERELANIEEQRLQLTRRSCDLTQEHSRLRSKAFIAANGICREDVQMMDADDVPWLPHVLAFAEWLRANSTKRFCEWCGVIYFTAEIMNIQTFRDRMPRDAPGRIEDLPGGK